MIQAVAAVVHGGSSPAEAHELYRQLREGRALARAT
jgi:hypothetical protein